MKPPDMPNAMLESQEFRAAWNLEIPDVAIQDGTKGLRQGELLEVAMDMIFLNFLV